MVTAKNRGETTKNMVAYYNQIMLFIRTGGGGGGGEEADQSQ